MSSGAHRFAMLDGWRALSILLVLAGHLFPIGPHRFLLNEAVAASGMAIFFILSGFLITRFLSTTSSVRVFVIRRFFRIVPLAWLAMATILIWTRADFAHWLANFLFFANLPPFWLVPPGAHLWSLCAEVQFYLLVACLTFLVGRRGLLALPVLCLLVTGLRIATGATISIVTWLRVDEILAGAILALAYGGHLGPWPERVFRRLNVYLLLPVLVASAHPAIGPLNYLRPYLAMMMVGASLYDAPPLLRRVFEHRATAYIATVSYALYIIHGVLGPTWLGTGDKLVKYAKRPLLLAVTFALSHASTFWFEQPCIRLAKRLSSVPDTKDVA